MKSSFQYFFIFLFVLSVNEVSAQHFTSHMGWIYYNPRDMIMRKKMGMMKLDNNDLNFPFTFIVTMNDGSKREINTKFYSDTVKHKIYLPFKDKRFAKTDSNRNQKIYPSQTISIERNLGGGGFDDNWFKGIPKDSCWMFKIISGPINAYSYLSIVSSNFVPSTLIAIQENDGPIINLNEENLKKMVGTDTGALESIAEKDYYKAIKRYNKDVEKTTKK